MPSQLDELIERLKTFDEVTLLELLGINAEEILERFRDRVSERREYLFGECEEMIYDVDAEFDDELDGYQVEEFGYREEE